VRVLDQKPIRVIKPIRASRTSFLEEDGAMSFPKTDKPRLSPVSAAARGSSDRSASFVFDDTV